MLANLDAFEAQRDALDAMRAAGAMQVALCTAALEAHAAALDAKLPCSARVGEAVNRRLRGAHRLDANVAALATDATAATEVGVVELQAAPGP